MANTSKSRKRRSLSVDTHRRVWSRSPSPPPLPPTPCHTYNTRLSVKQPPPLKKLQVAHAPLSPTRVSSFAAGSKAGHLLFLGEVGMVTTAVEPREVILTDDEAELLSCSLRHQCYVSVHRVGSVYFTPEQWERQTTKNASLVKGAKRLLKTARQHSNPDTWENEQKKWHEEEEKGVICCCKAHECEDDDLYTKVLGRLVMVAPPLTDDTGNVLATVLLSHIIYKSGLNKLYVQSSRTGTKASVKYILRCPSGKEYIYSGWPDFQISYMMSRAERRLGGRTDKLEETMRAVGEIQSPPGNSTEAKNRSFAQAGIYTLGQFCNTQTIQRLATVVLYKDLTVHVALATIARGSESGNTVGDVTYKPVCSVHPFNLRDSSDMAAFASVFIATLKSTIFLSK